jgi:ubiquinone/menaquinone biosynthesis C-methylase UbiE
MALTRSQVRAFYDRFGRKQDTQAFYEDAALEQLIAHAAFDQAEKVFEFGCGTGRFAARLLARQLPPSASYLGIDLSQTMVELARQRVAPFGARAQVALSDGSMRFPLPDGSTDRVVATYVFDILSESDVAEAIAEARRVLAPGGRLCLMSLTNGVTPASRIVSKLWAALYNLRPSLVGGCRPIRLDAYLDRRAWSVAYHDVIVRFGVPSEVLVASPGH